MPDLVVVLGMFLLPFVVMIGVGIFSHVAQAAAESREWRAVAPLLPDPDDTEWIVQGSGWSWRDAVKISFSGVKIQLPHVRGRSTWNCGEAMAYVQAVQEAHTKTANEALADFVAESNSERSS